MRIKHHYHRHQNVMLHTTNISIFKLTFLYLYWEWRGTSTCGKRSLTFKNQNICFMFFAKTCPKIWITWERRMCLCGRIASAATSQVESVASNWAHLHCTRFSTQNETHPTSTNLSNFSSNSDKSKGRGQNPQSRKRSVKGESCTRWWASKTCKICS